MEWISMEWVRKVFKEESPFILACPALLWQTLFFYLPTTLLLGMAIYPALPYIKDFLITASPFELINLVYLKIILNSIGFAALTTAICLVVAYPIAYFIAFRTQRLRPILLLLIILPSWTGIIVQAYAWFFILQRGGLLSQSIYGLGLSSSLPHLLNNKFAILLGMVYCFLPFMIYPIYNIFEKIEKSLLEASADLGATKFQTIVRIIAPLSIRGVSAGILLVFVPAFGEYAIIELLGGSKTFLWGNLVVSKYLSSHDYSGGAAVTALGIIVLILIMALAFLLFKFLRILLRLASQEYYTSPQSLHESLKDKGNHDG